MCLLGKTSLIKTNQEIDKHTKTCKGFFELHEI